MTHELYKQTSEAMGKMTPEQRKGVLYYLLGFFGPQCDTLKYNACAETFGRAVIDYSKRKDAK